MTSAVLVRGVLPLDRERRDDALRFVAVPAVSRIAEHSRLEHLSSFSSFDLGVALVGDALVSAISGKGVWTKARYGLLLDTQPEKLYVLVVSAEIAPLTQDASFFDIADLVERALEVVRGERPRY